MAAGSKWMEVRRRPWQRKDAAGHVVAEGLTANYYGRMKVDGRWKWFKLSPNERAARKQWEKVITDREHRAAGVVTRVMDFVNRSIAWELRAYLKHLRLSVTRDHLRVVRCVLFKLIRMAGWKRLGDMTAESLEAAVASLRDDGVTVSYANKHVTIAKSFVHWLMKDPPKIAVDPFASVRRGNVKRSKKRRGRRALMNDEATALFAAAPAKRHLAYALALLCGLLRGEAKAQIWADVKLDADVPHLLVTEAISKSGVPYKLPLHPRLVVLLKTAGPGMPKARVLATVPEIETLRKDLREAGAGQPHSPQPSPADPLWRGGNVDDSAMRSTTSQDLRENAVALEAGVAFVDELGLRADYHSLRHTHATNLDRTGCTPALKTMLTRHLSQTVEEDYTHAHLSDAYVAVRRLPDPIGPTDQGAMRATGTVDMTGGQTGRWSPTGHGLQRQVAAGDGTGRDGAGHDARRFRLGRSEWTSATCRDLPRPAASCLSEDDGADKLVKSGPSTQAD